MLKKKTQKTPVHFITLCYFISQHPQESIMVGLFQRHNSFHNPNFLKIQILMFVIIYLSQ